MPDRTAGRFRMTERTLRVGAAGLGRAFALMLPTLTADPRVELVAAADPRPEARARFAAEFGGRVYASVEALCADAEVDVVYVATPHQFHADHVEAAAAGSKHVLVEKPMAITLDECRRMIDAVERANVRLIVGHSHSFDAPILRAREIIAGGTLGAVRMINAQYYTDFMYRPRRPEELVTAQGGGAVFNQAAHQVDIVRLLGGGACIACAPRPVRGTRHDRPRVRMPRCWCSTTAAMHRWRIAGMRISTATSFAAASAKWERSRPTPTTAPRAGICGGPPIARRNWH